MTETIKPTALTTNEVTGRYDYTIESNILMKVLSVRQDAEHIAKFERVLAIAKDREEPKYEVSLIINGEAHDFRLFAREVANQIDRMVGDAAGRIVKERLGDTLEELAESANNAVKHLVEGVRGKAAEMLGYNPWTYE